MKPEDSKIMQVLRIGQPVYDYVEHLTTPHGDCVTNITSTLPIIQNGKIVGTIDLSRCIGDKLGQKVERPYIEMPRLERSGDSLYHLEDILSFSQKMNDIKQIIPKVANTDSAVMIVGETGTGKELVAQSIHTSGIRSGCKFVSQNCSAIPSTLLEGILFGTVKGSFTGAEDKPGLFELADGGTLFLDELNSMDIAMQAKIFKAIEEKQVRRIGGEKMIPFDARIVCAMNKDPMQCVKEGTLREDLFYRLSTVLIEVPPLRERSVDIPVMTSYFIELNNKRMGKNITGTTDEVQEFFGQYPWPGKVRELKNVIEGVFNVIDRKQIEMEKLPPYMTKHFEKERDIPTHYDDSLSLTERVEEYERRQIVRALDSTTSITLAAEKLKISKQALNYKLMKYGLKNGKK